MKLTTSLLATLLCCAASQSSAPVQHHGPLTQKEKNEKLFELIQDTSEKPEKYKSIEILKSQGAKVERKDLGLAIFRENTQLLNHLLYHDSSPEKFPENHLFVQAYKNINIMKLLASDRRFDVASGHNCALARELMAYSIVTQCKQTVLLIRYLGLDVTIPDQIGQCNLYYAQDCDLPASKEILAIVSAPADKLYTFMTPEQREEFAAIKAKRNQNQLQCVLNRQMGLTYAMHQQQLQEYRKRMAHTLTSESCEKQ